MPDAARSRATGSVRPTRPPFEAAYAAWPICPSNAATDDTLTIAPRSPAASGSLRLIAVAPMRTASNVPIRLIATTRLKASRSCAESYSPSRPMVRWAQLEGLVDGLLDLGRARDVDRHEHAADLARDRFPLLGVEVGDDHPRSVG